MRNILLLNYYVGILFFAVFVSGTFFIHNAFGASLEVCGPWDVKYECDMSGWTGFLIGDIAVGAVLAVLLHVLAHRSNMKLEQNSLEIRKNSENIIKIVESQEALRTARKDHALQNMRSQIVTLLFVLGIINRLTTTYNTASEQKSVFYTKIKGEEERLARLVQNIKNTMTYASDTLEPTLVDHLDGLCTLVDQPNITEKNGKLEFSKYEESKRKIDEVTKKIADASNPTLN